MEGVPLAMNTSTDISINTATGTIPIAGRSGQSEGIVE
jgi:hypothetical protein